jgi:DNA-binding IscR family transcriptional regulator
VATSNSQVPNFGQSVSKGGKDVIWFDFPMRLRTALKSLCCLAHSDASMQSQEISDKTGVSLAETAKIMPLLVLGGFVTSKRGSKGVQLPSSPDQITTGKVIDFFLAKHPLEPEGTCPVMCVLREMVTPCQEAFARLRLEDIASGALFLHAPRVARARVG